MRVDQIIVPATSTYDAGTKVKALPNCVLIRAIELVEPGNYAVTYDHR